MFHFNFLYLKNKIKITLCFFHRVISGINYFLFCSKNFLYFS
nr:MAG TPA: hypothetical protein [Caudoviricetes sp.]